MDTPTPFARWLKTARRRCNLTQEELGRRIGADRTYVNKIERGKVELPLLETRQRLHRALGTSEDDLLADGIVQSHPLRGSTIGKGVAHGDLTATKPITDRGTPGRPALTEVARRFLDSLTDQQRLDLVTFVEEADKVRHFDDYRDGNLEEAKGESPMAH